MGLFAKLYGGSWSVKSTESLLTVDSSIKSGVVCEGKFGKQVCFMLDNGQTGYLGLSRDSKLEVGEEFPIATAKVLTLSKAGENDAIRVQE
jgi:hypothetical protein